MIAELGRWAKRLTSKTEKMQVRFWGVRGSIACAGPEVQKYGGNTSCVEVRCGERLIIFDAGSGLRYLGEELNKNGAVNADLFLSHSHMDHICGLLFFGPLHRDNTRLRIWSGHLSNGWTTSDAVDDLMTEPLFPVSKDVFKAHIEYVDFAAGEDLNPSNDVRIRTALLNHPNGATGYRVEYCGKSICYVTDTEHREDGPDQAILDLIKDADIFIYDASYTDEEYPQYKTYGHSTWQEGARLAKQAGVKRYVAFHHDPSHNDKFMDRVAKQLKKAMPGAVVAREGMVLQP